MRIILVVGLTLLMSACGKMTNAGYFAPKAVDGDENHVVIYDANGIVPGNAIKSANAYCAKFGKSATLKMKGGDSYECVSQQLNYCATYSCE